MIVQKIGIYLREKNQSKQQDNMNEEELKTRKFLPVCWENLFVVTV